ncbi:MAG: CBS domain-containing protein [Kineosporiaceae bacterium]|nr:CBS domain-containing protein [Kineosporiaceae bacterium]
MEPVAALLPPGTDAGPADAADVAPRVIDLTTSLGELPLRAPFYVDADATVAGAAGAMRAARVSSALIRRTPEPGLGIVTSTDLRDRVLADGGTPQTPVAEVATWQVRSVPAGAPISSAVLLMLDEGFRHVPVVSDGEVIGLVSSSDILRHQAQRPMLLLSRLHSLDSLDGIEDYPLEVASAARSLLGEGMAATQVSRIVAGLNDALTTRLIDLAQARLGPAPRPFAWLALGSAGRLEQNLLTDQDNALVYADDEEGQGDPDRAEGEARAYFAALAETVNTGLTRAGFPPCPGGYMATNWCLPLRDWVQELRRLVHEPTTDALVETAVFLDFRRAQGELDVSRLDGVLLGAGDTPRFMVALAATASAFPPPLTTLGRVRSESGHLDLKRSGLYAVVILARIFAVQCGSPARSTLDRLREAAAGRVIGPDTARELADIYEFMLQLRLREQVRRIAAGEPVDNRIRLDDLTGLEQRRLRDGLRTLASIQRTTAARLRGDSGGVGR